MLGNLSNGFLGLTLCIHVLLIAAEVHAEKICGSALRSFPSLLKL